MTLEKPDLILASGSPRRAELLRLCGVPFEVQVPRGGEMDPGPWSPVELALGNAIHKARSVSRLRPDHWVLGADTVVAMDGESFGKPRDLEQARNWLHGFAGRTHQVITGCCLIRWQPFQRHTLSVVSDIRFLPAEKSRIEEYLQHVPVLDKAGAYGVQDRGSWIIDSVAGSLSNVIGLPVDFLVPILLDLGIPGSSAIDISAGDWH